MMTKEQKELKKRLEKLKVDKFLLDSIIKFYSVTINSILRKEKEVSNEKAISKY